MKKLFPVLIALISISALIFTIACQEEAPADKAIELAQVTVTAPALGATPNTVATVSPTMYTAGAVEWTDSSGAAVGSTFEADKQYTAKVELKAKGGYAFHATKTTATMNTNSATMEFVGKKSITVSYQFPVTGKTAINDAIALTVTAPAGNQAPNTTVSGAGTGYTAGPVAWTLLPAGTPVSGNFVSGSAYKATIVLTAASGYTFPAGKTNVTINTGTGNAATVTGAGDSITVSRDFAVLAKTISSFVITGQPTTLTYTHGDALNLTGLSLTVTYSDGTTAPIALGDFATSGVTTAPANMARLVRSTNNGNPVTVSITGVTQTTNNTTNNLTVNARGVTIQSTSHTGKVYDGNTSVTGLTITLAGVLTGDTVTATPATGANAPVFTSPDAGTHAIRIPANGVTLGGAQAANYTLTTTLPHLVTSTNGITQLPITINPVPGQNKNYGSADPGAPATLPANNYFHGFQFTTTPATLISDNNFHGALSRGVGEVVGNYPINAGSLQIRRADGGTNYNMTMAATGVNFAINRRPISTLTLNVASPVKNGIPATTAIVNAYTSTSDLSIGAVTWAPTVPSTGFEVGVEYTVSITVNNANTTNYTLINAGATIDGHPATVAATPAPTQSAATFSHKFAPVEDRTPLTITVISPPTKLEYIHGETFSLAGLQVKVVYDDGNAVDYTYGASNWADNLDSYPYDEVLSYSGPFNSAYSENSGDETYVISYGAVGDTTPLSAKGKIIVNKKDVTIASINHEKQYDGTEALDTDDVDFEVVLAGVLADDAINVGVDITAEYTDDAAGTKTIDVTAATLTGSAAVNYNLTGAVKEWTVADGIIPRNLTIIPDAGQFKEYVVGNTVGTDPELTFTTSEGPKATALIAGNTWAGALSRDDKDNDAIGSYLIVIGTLSAGNNYNLILSDSVLFWVYKIRDPGAAIATMTLTSAYNSVTVEASIPKNEIPDPDKPGENIDITQKIEFAYGTTNTVPSTGWMLLSGGKFEITDLTHATRYYVFARTIADENYLTGAVRTENIYTLFAHEIHLTLPALVDKGEDVVIDLAPRFADGFVVGEEVTFILDGFTHADWYLNGALVSSTHEYEVKFTRLHVGLNILTLEVLDGTTPYNAVVTFMVNHPAPAPDPAP